jgi:hypothetical protein
LIDIDVNHGNATVGSFATFGLAPDHVYAEGVGGISYANVTLRVTTPIIRGFLGLVFTLMFNTTVLDCVSISELPGGPLEAKTHTFMTEVNNTGGYVACLDFLSEPINLTEGVWPICSVAFNSTMNGYSTLDFDVSHTPPTQVFDGIGNEILSELDEGDIAVWTIRWTPTCPPPYEPSNVTRTNEPVLVTAAVTGQLGFFYRVNESEWWNTTMTYNTTSQSWAVLIPGQPGGTLITFYMEASTGGQKSITSAIHNITVKALPLCDVNGDGTVEMMDYFVMGQHYLEQDP